MVQQNKPLPNSSVSFSLRKKKFGYPQFLKSFPYQSSYALQSLGILLGIKKSRTNARQIWKIFRDKINLSDFRKGTLKKMQWEAT